MNEITISLTILALTIVSVFTGVFRTKAIQNIFTYRFIRIIGGSEKMTQEDLKDHYIFVKFSTLDLVRIGQIYTLFASPLKYDLFEHYVKCVISVMEESLLNILKQELLDLTEPELKKLLLKESKWRENEYNVRFRQYLSTKVSRTEDIDLVLRKVELWRRKELIATTDSSLEVISFEKGGSSITKMYTIFHQYALCLEIMIHSGAESFNLMNGELEALLNNNIKPK